MFDWKTMEQRDAYSVKQFGEELNNLTKATSRDKRSGTVKGVSMGFDIEDETVLTPNELLENKKKRRETQAPVFSGPLESGFD